MLRINLSIIKNWIKNNLSLLAFITLMVFFRSAVADWYSVPTGSMEPTIEIGDRIIVNKMAYDFKMPLTNISIKKIREPLRGDIIVFESEAANNRLIKRVIGLPGDSVSMSSEALTINGEELNYQALKVSNGQIATIEDLAGIKHIVKFDSSKSKSIGTFAAVTVPQGHYLVLGDNRRNSADSRVYGFVPRKEIKGKATHIAFSLNYDNYYLPKSNRYLQSLYLL